MTKWYFQIRIYFVITKEKRVIDMYNPIKHYESAQSLINESKYRQACLDLRLCYESYIYNAIIDQADKFPDYILKQWQPKKIIEKVEILDPLFSKECSISISFSDKANIIPNSNTFIPIAEKEKLSSKFFRCYHKLGKALHASTPLDLKRDQDPESCFKKIANEALIELGKVIENPKVLILNINKMSCPDCNHENVFSNHMIENKISIVCDNPNCHAKLMAYHDDVSGLTLNVCSKLIECHKCKGMMSIPLSLNIDGGSFCCKKCNANYHYKSNFEYALVDTKR